MGAADGRNHGARARRAGAADQHGAAATQGRAMRRQRTHRTRAREGIAGFTLIETLIATALMVATLAALATVTAQWLPNWNRGFVRAQRTELLSDRKSTRLNFSHIPLSR